MTDDQIRETTPDTQHQILPQKMGRLIFGALFFAILISGVCFLTLIPNAYAISWYNNGWTYRMPITIDNTSNGNTLTNYQVKVSITYDSNMQSDFDDIRFADSDGTTLLNYYLETKTDSVSAIFYVKIPNISANANKTIYAYFGNSGVSTASNGPDTFETRGFDNFESYDTGSLSTVAASNAWTEYAGDPVLATTDSDGFGSVLKDGDLYHHYFGYGTIRHATSTDGKNWNMDTANNPVISASQAWEDTTVGVPEVWKEGSLWYMIYRGGNTSKLGLATSTDGITWNKSISNPILQGTSGQWDDTALDCWGTIKVDSTYYHWYSWTGGGIGRKIGLATSTDLIHWSKDSNNPIFSEGRFCAYPFKYGSYYYLLLEHYTYSSDYSQIELYRDTNPTFYPTDREFLGVPINFGATGAWNAKDQDTPAVVTDDIYRNTYNATGNQLWTYFSGSPDGSAIWHTGLTIEPDIAAALAKVNYIPASYTWYSNTAHANIVSTPARDTRALTPSNIQNTNPGSTFTEAFGPKTTGVVSAWMQRDSKGAGVFDVYLYSGATVAAAAGFGATSFHYYSGSSFVATSTTYLANTWYRVTLEFNTDTDTYNFAVYDVSGSEILRQNNITGGTAGVIDQVLFQASPTNQVGGYIDDFSVRQYSTPEPITSTGSPEEYTAPVSSNSGGGGGGGIIFGCTDSKALNYSRYAYGTQLSTCQYAQATTTPVAATTTPITAPVTATPIANNLAISFPRTLYFGLSGSDVSLLQTLLKSWGYYTYPEITGYFGGVTKAAVAALQIAEGIEPIGSMGPITREKVLALADSNTISATTSAPSAFTRNLQLYNTGEDVRALQQYLNAHGFPVAPTGAGSAANETTYFGFATQAALIAFQSTNGIIPAAGYFGPKTRALISSQALNLTRAHQMSR